MAAETTLSQTTLAQSPLVSLKRFEHTAELAHRDPPEEQSSCWTVNFIERGTYEVLEGRRWHTLSPQKIFVTWPGLIYRCRHREEVPRDVCLSVELTEGLASDAPIPRTVAVAVTNRLAYAK